MISNINTYPNLAEILKYHPYGEPTACDFAQIEPEVLHAALDGKKLLESVEIIRLALLYRCPEGVIRHHKSIMLDMGRWKHRVMSAEIDSLYMRLKYMAKCEKNEKAVGYLGFCEWEMQRFMKSAYDNKLSYGNWLGTRHQIQQYIMFSTPQPQRRSL